MNEFEHQENQPLTKLERRALKKEMHRENREHRQLQKKSKNLLVWGSVIVIIIAILFGIYKYFGEDQIPVMDPLEVTGIDQIKGPKDAPITLMEFSDFQCPACATQYPNIKALHETFPKDLRIVYKHYPLNAIHQNAQLAAQVSEAAGAQGKFWEMHDTLFENQSEWSTLGNPSETFQQYAEQMGLNIDQLKTDINESSTKTKIKRDIKSGNMLGITGTPTFFLNGEQIKNPTSKEAFIKLVQEELEKKETP